MGTGILFAADELMIQRIRKMRPEERPVYISEKVEELYFEEYPERTCELEGSWEAIHRALTGGSFLFDGSAELTPVILGGEVLYYDGDAQDDFIISAKTPEQVKAIAEKLPQVSEAEFRKGYKAISADEYPYKSSEDCEEAFGYMSDSISFWRFAAKNGLWVLFTADL